MLNVGDKAPDFVVRLGGGGQFKLSNYRGQNVVLFFYPKAFTYGCTQEVGGFCDVHDHILAKNAVVLGISADSVETLSRFAKSTEAPFGLGSDETKLVRKLYDVERRFGLGTSRVTYVIDGDGVIQGVYHNEIVMSSHIRSALGALEELV